MLQRGPADRQYRSKLVQNGCRRAIDRYKMVHWGGVCVSHLSHGHSLGA